MHTSFGEFQQTEKEPVFFTCGSSLVDLRGTLSTYLKIYEGVEISTKMYRQYYLYLLKEVYLIKFTLK